MNMNVIAIIAVWAASILVGIIIARDTQKAYTALEELEELGEKMEEHENTIADLYDKVRDQEETIYRLNDIIDQLTDPEVRRFL